MGAIMTVNPAYGAKYYPLWRLTAVLCLTVLGPGCAGRLPKLKNAWFKVRLPVTVMASGDSCGPTMSAAKYWNDVVGLRLFRVRCTHKDLQFGDYEVVAVPELRGYCTSEPHGNVLGCAYKQLSGGDIMMAVVTVAHNHEKCRNNNILLGNIYRHELGHVLGLGHIPRTVMDARKDYPQASWGQIEALRRTYGFKDSSSFPFLRRRHF